MHKLCNGKVPKLHEDILDDEDRKMIEEIQNSKFKIQNNIETFRFRDALFEVMELARKGNKYLQVKEPWKQSAANGQQPADGVALPPVPGGRGADNCLHICLQLTANLAIFINPFLPNTAKKMLGMMKVVDKMLYWENAGSMKLLNAGYPLRAPELLFRKIEDAEITAQVEKLKNGLIKTEVAGSRLPDTGRQQLLPSKSDDGKSAISNLKSEIVFDDFAKIDLRVGKIVAAEKVEKADKLLKLSINLGFETRTIVSGIALHYKPEDIVGMQVTVVANLAPRKMRGIESNGMILMAEDSAGKLHFINPHTEVENGAQVS